MARNTELLDVYTGLSKCWLWTNLALIVTVRKQYLTFSQWLSTSRAAINASEVAKVDGGRLYLLVIIQSMASSKRSLVHLNSQQQPVLWKNF